VCTRRRKANRIGRNTLLKKDRRKCTRDVKTKKKTKQLLDDLEDKGRYWKLKEKALDRTF
jgi:hypothetical protein